LADTTLKVSPQDLSPKREGARRFRQTLAAASLGATLATALAAAPVTEVTEVTEVTAVAAVAAITQEPSGQAAEQSAPTPVEQALMEHWCSATRATSAGDAGAYPICLSAQLQLLRSDFGRDLSRLTASERRSLDSVCNRIRTAEGRDAYVGCLGTQLVALRNRRIRSAPPPVQPAAPAAPAAAADAATVPPVQPGAAATSVRTSRGSPVIWIGALLGTAVLAAGGTVLMKRRRPSARCRTCGLQLQGRGDLCPNCRHEAAEAQRRASTERAESERAQEEAARRQREHEDEWRRQKEQQDEEERQRLQDRARQEEQTRRDEEARRRAEEEAQERSRFGAAEEAFDPHAVLGLPADASAETIRAAYEQAKSKYDADHVAHLSAEVQEHFRAKAEAVERAYLLLTTG
jgi:hypothetical protein